MALSKNAGLKKLAQVFEVDTKQLTPAAAKLTKGDLMQLNDAQNDVDGLLKYAKSGAPSLAVAQKRAKAASLKLTVEDLNSIQRVFGSPRIPRNRLQKLRRPKELPNVSVYACCCPCCCATAVISPSRPAVV